MVCCNGIILECRTMGTTYDLLLLLVLLLLASAKTPYEHSVSPNEYLMEIVFSFSMCAVYFAPNFFVCCCCPFLFSLLYHRSRVCIFLFLPYHLSISVSLFHSTLLFGLQSRIFFGSQGFSFCCQMQHTYTYTYNRRTCAYRFIGVLSVIVLCVRPFSNSNSLVSVWLLLLLLIFFVFQFFVTFCCCCPICGNWRMSCLYTFQPHIYTTC